MASFRVIALVFTVLVGSASESLASITSVGDVELGFDIRIAQQADGSLTVAAPTTLADVGDVYIATDPHLTGAFTIDGTTVSTQGSQFVVGEYGNGTLEIRNGGVVTSSESQNTQLVVGGEFGSIGTVKVRGNGSRHDFAAGAANIGGAGTGTMLIEDSARATYRSIAIASSEFSGEGAAAFGSATVRGVGSMLESRESLFVGSRAIGELRVEDGAQVLSGTQEFGTAATIGHYPFGGFNDGLRGSGSVFVDGSGSLLSHNGTLVVGGTGSGSMSITNGGVASNGIALIGGDPNFNQNASGSGLVTLAGPGSQWNVTNMILGHYGTGQVLLSDGARLVNSNLEFFSGSSTSGHNTVLGAEAGSYGRMVVDGIATQWVDNSETLTIGSRGTGELIIQGGAVVSSNEVLISPSLGGRGEALVTGIGSRWLVDSIGIGLQGGRGKLIIADGASVQDVSTSSGAHVYEDGELVLDQGTFYGSSSSRRRRVLNNFGMVRGNGNINALVSNQASGRVRIGNGETLVVSERLENLGGQIEVLSGELTVDGSFVNEIGGTLVADNSTLRFSTTPFSGTIDYLNEGSFLVSGGQNSVFGTTENQGGIVLAGNSQTTFFDDVKNDGSINVTTGSVATFLGSVSGNGASGGGTINLESDISPGFSPGVMEFGGDVLLGNFSQLNIEVGQEDHDSLEIAGSASIDGNLLLSALSALDGDTMLEILSADSISGMFDSIPVLGAELGFGVVFGGINYSDNSVEISLLQQSGDFTGDGSVDGADLDAWQAGYGSLTGAGLADGDAQRDADVDGLDFLTWQQTLQAPSPPAASQAVPEPASIVTLLLCLATLVGRRQCPSC